MDSQQLQKIEIVSDWLSPTDFPAQQHDHISSRQEGTGQWLLDSPQFKGWIQGSQKTLFCPGIPGAGKTTMAAVAIDHLSTLLKADVELAYVFCNYKSTADQDLYSLLSALLKQLGKSWTGIRAPVISLYDECSREQRKPSVKEIFETLSAICLNYARVYIVVDALDESSDQDGTRGLLIEKLRELQTMTDVRLLFTSRFIPEITEKFGLDPVLEVQASDEDVKRYVAGQIPRLPKCIRIDDELIFEVQSKIIEAIRGM